MRWALVGFLALAAGCPLTISKPDSDPFMDAMADADRHAHHGRLDEANEAYARAAQLAGRRVDRDEALYRQSRVLRDQERYAEAVEVLDVIAHTVPASRRTARAIYDASVIRDEELGQTDQAIEGYERIMRQFAAEGPAGRALFYRLRQFEGKTTEELAYVREMYPQLQDTPLGDDLLMREAEILLEKGDREGGRAALERLVRAHPYPQGHRWDDAMWKLADLDEEDGRPERAIARLDAIASRNEVTTIPGSYTLPSFPRAAIRIARIYRDRLGDRSKAASAYRRMMREFPNSSLRDDAMVELGELYLDDGEAPRGCAILRDAVEEYEVGSARRRAAERVEADCNE